MLSEIRVLHVDDEPDFAELVSEFLQRVDDRIEVETVTRAEDALGFLADGDFDCVVSDYEMPRMDGLELLEEVRETQPDLPFILFTGRGSEEVASEAISAGVTDYLQKESGIDQYTVLANRVRNAVEMRRNERELRKSRKRLNLFFEKSPLGVVEWDDEFRLVRMNERAEEILGYEESELEGESWGPIVPESDEEEVAEVIEGLLENKGGYHSINENVTKDGEKVVCEWHNRVITDESDETMAVFSQFHDVTDEKEYERELLRYRQMVNSMHEAACVYDEEGRFVVVNDYLADFYGMTPEELEGEKSSLVPSLSEGTYEELLEGDRKEIHGEVENEFPGHGHAVLEYTLTRLISDAGFEGVVGVARDVTERKERERELRKNERRFEAVFEDPKMLVGLLDSDGTVLRINSTAMGYTEDESDDVVGEPFWETSWWQTDDELRADARRWTERAGDGEYVEFEAEHVRPGGATATVSGVFRPVTEEGEVSSVVASARDITERKEREKTIKRRNELLEDVAGFLSHDMRTPLTTVRGWLEMAVETGETEHVERSFTALDRMEELLADMTDVLRTGEVIGETEEVRLEEAVETVSETVQASELTIEVENSPRVECDEEALRRILENLVSNSVEHDAKDGDTEVRIGEMDEGFYYEDDGPGIPEEKRDDIFKPGFSTKSGSKGTGMGLASVRQTVLAHGWDIRVGDAETLDGARFEVLTDV